MSVFFFKGRCIITILMSLAKKLHTRANSIWIMTETALSVSYCVLKLKSRLLLFWGEGVFSSFARKEKEKREKKGEKGEESYHVTLMLLILI